MSLLEEEKPRNKTLDFFAMRTIDQEILLIQDHKQRTINISFEVEDLITFLYLLGFSLALSLACHWLFYPVDQLF